MSKMTIDEILEYIHPACKYAKSFKSDMHKVCSGQIIDGKTIVKCHCDCHNEREENDN